MKIVLAAGEGCIIRTSTGVTIEVPTGATVTRETPPFLGGGAGFTATGGGGGGAGGISASASNLGAHQ
jgi:hypothetical protein